MFNKDEALKEMQKGNKISNQLYTDNEFLYMKNGIIYDENDYKMGDINGEFWTVYQKFTEGWFIYGT